MNYSIFRAYDIRGVYGKDLTENIAYLIGKAFTQYLQEKYKEKNLRIIVGKDNRSHGELLQKAFIQGLLESKVKVDRLEDATTPMVYFAVHQGKYDAGVSVTASHNPPEYNGFKLVGRGARSICGEELKKIESRITNHELRITNYESRITNYEWHGTDVEKEYSHAIYSRVKLKRKLSIVVDAGNGIAGKYYPKIIGALGCSVHQLFCEQDGNFPNHEPDPVVEKNTNDLKKIVLEKKADLGVAFDGDGDRLAIVDEHGQYHDANETFVILIRDLLARKKGPADMLARKIIHTVSSSLIVSEEIRRLGGIPIITPVGHSFVEEAMRKEKALLGGEQSGHFFLAEDYFGFDDACFAAAKLLQIFSNSDQPVSAHYDAIPKYFSLPETRPRCTDEKKFEIIKKITDELSRQYKVNTLDGVRVDFKDGWLGIRASNTSPCLSVIVEGKTLEARDRIEELSKTYLKIEN